MMLIQKSLLNPWLCFVITAVIIQSPVHTAHADSIQSPVIPGLYQKHTLTPNETGQILINELNCSACHRVPTVNSIQPKTAPDLSDAGARLSPTYIQQFITTPSTIHPGTTMPDILHKLPADKKSEVATAITHYLVSQSQSTYRPTQPKAEQITKGEKLYHTVGCVVCHAPQQQQGSEINQQHYIGLAHVNKKYHAGSISDFLFQPRKVRPAGRMPDMKLTRAEADAIAAFLIRQNPKTIPPLKPDQQLAETGKAYFQQFQCSNCHQTNHHTPQSLNNVPLKSLTAGCLSETASQSPRYNLSTAQRQAIKSALSSTKQKNNPTSQINITLTTFNCIACHVRDDFGGVNPELNDYFQTSEPGLGNEARIPPPLTGVGAKLQLKWTQQVLFDAQSIRPYMHTRMPQYGENNLRHLPELFTAHDTIKQVDMPEPERKQRGEIHNAGALLVGDKALNCVACHNFNAHESEGLKGLDLITSTERLQPSWFYHYMLAPAKYRPGIVMPNYWPNGESIRPEILKGDTHQQINAIWQYLSLGRSARNPSGIRSEGTKLVVTDKVRTYRGRSNVAGYRGIAVGFPGGLNYAFNAKNGALSAIWTGEYISVGWRGQGAGNFNPASRTINLPQDIAFYQLPKPDTPWPLRPRTTKEQPVDPDPLYPWRLGYQFKGYILDDNDNPTLMYRIYDINIQDQSAPTRNNNTLTRTLSFDSPKSQTLWFRPLTGTIQQLTPTQYKLGKLTLTIPELKSIIRKTPDDKNPHELLLQINIPEGKSKLVLRYEISQ